MQTNDSFPESEGVIILGQNQSIFPPFPGMVPLDRLFPWLDQVDAIVAINAAPRVLERVEKITEEMRQIASDAQTIFSRKGKRADMLNTMNLKDLDQSMRKELRHLYHFLREIDRPGIAEHPAPQAALAPQSVQEIPSQPEADMAASDALVACNGELEVDQEGEVRIRGDRIALMPTDGKVIYALVAKKDQIASHSFIHQTLYPQTRMVNLTPARKERVRKYVARAIQSLKRHYSEFEIVTHRGQGWMFNEV